MKSTRRLRKSDEEIEKLCRAKVEEFLVENYEKIVKDGAFQMLAVAFVVLTKEFGFGAVRLKRLKDLIENEFILMKNRVCGRQYTSDDCKAFLKNKYNIDFEETCYTAEGWRNERNTE